MTQIAHDSQQAVTMPFADFMARFVWEQGEHVIVIGPTGCGKTTLLRHILQRRSHVVFFATKVRDDSISKFKKTGYKIIRRWPPPWGAKRVVLWPKVRSLDSTRQDQASVFSRALSKIYMAGGWCIAFDELHYMTDELGAAMDQRIKMLHHQGRSTGLSIVDASQRPAFIPVIVYSSASHAFLWSTPEDRDLKRLAQFAGLNSADLERVIKNLGKHQFVYLNTRKGDPPIISQVA